MIQNRRSYRLPFRTKLLFGDSHRVNTGITANISTGGIFVTTLAPFERDTLCRCVFAFDATSNPISIEARVQRVIASSTNPEEIPGMGLGFDEKQAEVLTRVQEYMATARTNFELAATILSSAEPDLASLEPLLMEMQVPPFSDLGELRFYIERILKAIELVDTLAQPAVV